MMIRLTLRVAASILFLMTGIISIVSYAAMRQSSSSLFLYSSAPDPLVPAELYGFDSQHAIHIRWAKRQTFSFSTRLIAAANQHQFIIHGDVSGKILLVEDGRILHEFDLDGVAADLIFWRPDSSAFGVFTLIEVNHQHQWFLNRLTLPDGQLVEQRLPTELHLTGNNLVRWLPDDTLRIATITKRRVTLQQLDLDSMQVQTLQVWDFPMQIVGGTSYLDPAGERLIVPAIASGGFDFELYQFTVGQEDVLNISNAPLRNDTQPAGFLNDGRLVYAANNGLYQMVLARSLETGEETTLYQSDEGRLTQLNLTDDGRFLAFTANDGSLFGDSLLCLFSPATQETTCSLQAGNVGDMAFWQPR